MKWFMAISTIIIFTSCSVGQDVNDTSQIHSKYYKPPHVENPCDSILSKRECFKQERILYNSKKLNAYTYIKDVYGKIMYLRVLVPESENKIDLSFLKNGAYYFEVYDSYRMLWYDSFIIHNDK